MRKLEVCSIITRYVNGSIITRYGVECVVECVSAEMAMGACNDYGRTMDTGTRKPQVRVRVGVWA